MKTFDVRGDELVETETPAVVLARQGARLIRIRMACEEALAFSTPELLANPLVVEPLERIIEITREATL